MKNFLLGIVLAWLNFSCAPSPSSLLSTADSLAKEGKSSEAEIAYRKAIQADPKSAEGHYRMGRFLASLGKTKEPREALAVGLAAAPPSIALKLLLTELDLNAYLTDTRMPPNVKQRLEQLSKGFHTQDNRPFEALWIDGQLALLAGRGEEALTLLEKARSIQKDHPQVTHGLLLALLGLNRPAEAEQIGRDFLTRIQSTGEIYDVVYEALLRQKRPAEAESIFLKKVSDHPGQTAYRLQLAAHYFNTTQLVSLHATIEPLLKDSKTFPQGLMAAADFYSKIRIWDRAEEILRRVASNSPQESSRALKLLIQAQLAQSKPDAALASAEQAVQSFPKDDEARLLRASLWIDSRDPARIASAIPELETIRAGFARDPRYWLAMARAQQSTGDFKKAESSYRQAIQSDRTYQPAYVSAIEMALESGQPKQALEVANQAIALENPSPQLRYLHARALLENGQVTQARSSLAALSSSAPANPLIQIEYGLALLSERRLDAAEAILRKYAEPPAANPRALEGLVKVLGQRGQGRKALELLQAEVRRNPSPMGTRRLLAKVALAEKQEALAVEVYRQIASEQPKVSLHHYELAQALRAQGNGPAAIASLEKACELAPENPVPISLLAFALQEQGRNAEAIPLLRKLLRLRPEDHFVQNNLAFVLAESGQMLDEALTLANRALQLSPGNPTYLDTLGWIYSRRKMYAEAIPNLRAAAQKQPSNSTALFHLGVTLIDQRQVAEGRSLLQRALAAKPSKIEEARIRSALQGLN